MMGAFQLLHLLGVTVWVGGMFFAYFALRPTAAVLLPPELRLPLWAGVFGRFFPWVWGAVVMILVSGTALVIMAGGMGNLPPTLHAMTALGGVMMGLFIYIYFGPYPRLKRAVAEQEWPVAAGALNRIRQLIAINLTLGILNILLSKGAYVVS